MNPIKNKKQAAILKKIGLGALSLVLFLLCSGALYVTKLASLPQTLPPEQGNIAEVTNANIEKVTEEVMDDYWTVALFGVDSRNDNLGAGSNADSQMILTINKANGEIRAASVYRDTFLMTDINGEECAKINSAYMTGGPLQNVVALNTNLDLEISDYISFSWKGAADAVNLLGGIDLELSEAEWSYINSFITETVDITGIPSAHIENPGKNHLDGVQTVAYCRLRLMDSDFKRTERQRKVLELVLEKVKEEDLETLLQMMETVLPQVSTSINLEDITMMAKNAKDYRLAGTMGFPGKYEEARLGRRGACLIPNTLESNVTELHRFLYRDEQYQCSVKVKEIGKEILKQAVKN